MIYSPYLWGRSSVAAELDGGADALRMIARRPALAPAPLHPYIAAAVPAIAAAAGAPAALAAAAGSGSDQLRLSMRTMRE